MRREASDLLREGTRELGLGLDDRQIAAFMAYQSELLRWNRAYNLTGLTKPADIIIKHFLDSLLFSRGLPPKVGSVADIGTGAGFPGIPLKIAKPALDLYLIEPSQKKAAFLRNICSRLELKGVEVINRRIEEVDGLKVDAAVTRALFSVADFMKKAGGILNKGGVLLLSKGPRVGEELKGIGQDRISVIDLVLPLAGIIRHLVVVKT